MTTIHLTDAQRDTFTACGLIVIEGEVTECAYAADATEDNRRACLTLDGPCPKNCPTRAPEGWRILTEPCDTCRSYLGHSPNFWLEPCPNPDCVGGRRVVTLTATCPSNDCENGRLWDDREMPHADCDGTGVVTLGRFTIPALLPVVGSWSGGDSTDVAIVVAGVGAYLWSDKKWRKVPLDPLPRPGQFIARPEAVT